MWASSGRFKADQSINYWLYLHSGKVTLATMYLAADAAIADFLLEASESFACLFVAVFI
jgi:hypothetical protein